MSLDVLACPVDQVESVDRFLLLSSSRPANLRRMQRSACLSEIVRVVQTWIQKYTKYVEDIEYALSFWMFYGLLLIAVGTKQSIILSCASVMLSSEGLIAKL